MKRPRGSFRLAALLARQRAEAFDRQYKEQRQAKMLESALYNLTQAKALMQFADTLEAMHGESA